MGCTVHNYMRTAINNSPQLLLESRWFPEELVIAVGQFHTTGNAATPVKKDQDRLTRSFPDLTVGLVFSAGSRALRLAKHNALG